LSISIATSYFLNQFLSEVTNPVLNDGVFALALNIDLVFRLVVVHFLLVIVDSSEEIAEKIATFTDKTVKVLKHVKMSL
jgi:hypothetical protein